MFSLLSCVETFKEIEIFVEQYCINCKGIEKIYILVYFDGFRIFRILNKRLHLVCLSMGRTIIFLEAGDENFSKTNNFLSVSLSVKTFFFWCHLPAFSCLQKM